MNQKSSVAPSLDASERRQSHRYSVLHLPGITGQLNFRSDGSALIDISEGGCKFRYLENSSFRFFVSPPAELSKLTYVTIEWSDHLAEPLVIRSKIRHASSMDVADTQLFEMGFEFYPHERRVLTPLLETLKVFGMIS